MPVELHGGRAAGEAFLDRLGLFERATSIGGISSGASHPASTSHRQLDERELAAAGIAPGLIRLAVGCEDLPDLLADLRQALGG